MYVQVRLIHLEWKDYKHDTLKYMQMLYLHRSDAYVHTFIYMYACTSEQLKATLSHATQINRHYITPHTTPHHTTPHTTPHHTTHHTTPHMSCIQHETL